MSQPNVNAHLTSSYDYLDDVEGVIELEIVPERIVHVEHVELEATTLDEVWELF